MKRALALTTLLLLAGLPIVSHAQWNTPQIVDDSGNPGQYTALAHDSSGTPHIFYAGNSDHGVYHAISDGLGGWSIEQVFGGSNDSRHIQVLIDESDVLHIAWHYTYGNTLQWAYRDESGSWIQTSIGYTSGRVSFVMGEDALGNPSPHFVVYYGSRLVYYYYDTVSESWESEAVDESYNVGDYASMAIDGTGRLYVSYYDSGGKNLKFAHHDGTDWTTFLVDGLTEDVGKYTSLVLDASGVPHVTYYDETNGELKHATINLGS